VHRADVISTCTNRAATCGLSVLMCTAHTLCTTSSPGGTQVAAGCMRPHPLEYGRG